MAPVSYTHLDVYKRQVPKLSTWEEIESTGSEEVERAFYGEITPEEAALLARQRTEEYFQLAVRP